MRQPCVRPLGSDGREGQTSGPLGSTLLSVNTGSAIPYETENIQDLADLAPWADAPLLPYDEAVEYVANACGIIEFGDETVTVKISTWSATRESLPLAVQVLETLSRLEKRLKELRHEMAEIETRQKKLRETDFVATTSC